MKAFKIGFILALLPLSHAASAAEPVFGTSTESQSTRALKPPQGKAIIYIYQRPQDGSGTSPTIWLNNYDIGKLVPGSFTVWQLAPGRLEIRVDGHEPSRFTISSEAGKTYLFRLSVMQTAAGPKAQITSLPESYRSDMVVTQLLKNPRQLTQDIAKVPIKPAESTAKTATPTDKPAVTDSPDSTAVIAPGGIGLILKTGALTLSEETQTILGTDFRFDDSASGLLAIEAYYQFGSGLAVGGEIMSYTANFTTVGFSDTHDVDVLTLLGNVKQYFRTDTSLQPFIGAGIGFASTDISGPAVEGSTSGLAYQLMAGVEYRGKDIGVFGEYKYISADTEDSSGERVDVSGSGFFAGVAFHF